MTMKLSFQILLYTIKTVRGGVMLAMDTSISSKLLTSPNNIEVVTVEILGSNPYRVCLLYNPPNSGTDYQDNYFCFHMCPS